MKAKNPIALMGYLVYPIELCGGAVAGVVCGVWQKEKSVSVSFLAGCIYLILIWMLALPFGSGFSLARTLTALCTPILSMLVGHLVSGRKRGRLGNRRKAKRYAGKVYRGRH